MTVKELKELLDSCNEDAIVYVSGIDFGTIGLRDEDVFQEYSEPKGEDDDVMTTDVIIRVP